MFEYRVVMPAPPDPCAPVRALDAAVDDVVALDFADLGPRELLEVIAQLEQSVRRMEAALDGAVADVERRAAFVEDGHRSVGAFLRATCRSSAAEASGRAKTARVLAGMPCVSAGYRAGAVPVAHVRCVARALANPRVRDLLADAEVDARIAEQARVLEHRDFADWLGSLVSLADQDGAEAADDAAHDARSVSLRQTLDGSWLLRGQLPALPGTVLQSVLARFEESELDADWADARERLDDEAVYADLSRTPAQRRADALVALGTAASTASGRPSEPVVHLLIDQETFERELVREATGVAEPDVRDPGDVVCRSLAGDRLLARDVVATAIAGLVQRVVVDEAGVVIDMGRRRRLFTGAARQAALIQAALRLDGRLRCLYPGCAVPGRATQIDHRIPFRDGGCTDQSNADPKCRAHNLLKEAGFVAERRPDGTWRTRRPDGSPFTVAV